MSESVETATKIQAKINALDTFRGMLNKFVANKELSIATVAYEKAKGIVTESLKHDGHPVSIIESMAKGRCAELKGDVTHAEIKYKAIILNIQILQSQLNGYQSINRHLANV
jgi:translation elongation factor EF-Ts